MCATLAAGVGLASAFDQAGAARGWRSDADGLRIGLLTFATLAPATIVSNARRAAGLPASDGPASAFAIVLAIASGAAAGWLVTRTRAALLFAGFLPMCAAAGLALSATATTKTRSAGDARPT